MSMSAVVLKKMDTGSYQIYLVDSAKFSEVPATDLFHIDAASFGGDLDYGFILRCSTPAPDYLEALKLPNLNQFRVNEVVEVIISSLFEPCLAVLGSTTKHFSRIRAESIIQGMSGEDTQSRQINFLDPEPSLSGVTSGQYPPAQPYLFEMFTLLTVVAFISLEKVFIRDILSCIRLSFLQEIINDFYGADQCRQQMQFLDCADPLPDLPCVVFDEVSKQYLRAKILRLSGDRTIADVLAVDYPDVVVKEIELGSLYLLSDRFKLQPQCFSVRLAGIVDDEELYHFSSIAEHFLTAGSVVSAANRDKVTSVSLKCVDDADVLEKIGYVKMQKKNDISDQIQLFEKLLVLGNSASSTAQCKRFRSVEKPAVLVNNSFLPIAAVGNSSFIPVDSQQSTSSSSISAPQKPSILKKSDYEVPRTKVPIGSIAALISHIAGPDSIFLRTAPLSGSYAKLQEYMQGNMESKQKWLGRDELKVSRILEQDEWRRNCILKKGSNGLDLTFQDIDFGAIVEILENSFVIEWSDRICRAPNEIAEWRKPLVLPFRLSTKFDSKYRSDPQSIAELRKLIPDEKVFFFNKLELEEEDESMADAKIFGKHSQETSKKMSMPETKEVLLFKSDESNINDCFDQIVMKIAKDNEDEKYAWA